MKCRHDKEDVIGSGLTHYQRLRYSGWKYERENPLQDRAIHCLMRTNSGTDDEEKVP